MRLSAAVAVGVLVCAVSTARAQQPSAEFKKEYQAGIDAYRLGKYDEATTHLEAAKKIDATLPGPWRWLAAIAQTDGRWPDCVESAREALRLNPKSTEAGATRTLHDECRAAWGKPAYAGEYDVGQGALAINTDQVGASVEVNGIKYGSTPMAPRTFTVGETEVSVSKTGFLTQSRKVVVIDGIVTDVDFVLEVDPNAEGPDITPPDELTHGWIKVTTSAPGAEVRIDAKQPTLDAQGRYEVTPGPHEVTVTAPGHEGMTRKVRVTKGQLITVDAPLRSQAKVDATRKRGRMILGAGVGMVVAGLVTGVVSLRASDEARGYWEIENSRPTTGDTSGIEPIHSRAEIEKLVDRSKTFAIISDVAYGVGFVAVAVGAYFLVKGRPAGDRPTVTVAPTPDGAAAFAEVHW